MSSSTPSSAPASANPGHQTVHFQSAVAGPSLSYMGAPSNYPYSKERADLLADARAAFVERLRADDRTPPSDLFRDVRDAMSRAGLLPVLYDPETSTLRSTADDGGYQPVSAADGAPSEGAENDCARCPCHAGEPSFTGVTDGDEACEPRERVEVVAVEECRVPLATGLDGEERREQGPAHSIVPVAYLLGGKNEKIPALSKLLELRLSAAGTPQGVYATSDISPGEVVAIDQPYICGPAPYYKSICHYGGCLKMTATVIICPNCSIAQFCNYECLRNSIENGHEVECPILCYIQTVPGNFYLNKLALQWFLKECSKKDVRTFCSTVTKLEKTKKFQGFDRNGIFESNNFLAAYSMRAKGTSSEILFFFNCIAVEILEHLMITNFKIPKCYIATAGASIAHMLNVLDNNCRKLFVHNPSLALTTIKDTSYPIAYALYPSIGLFNHSCDANVKQSGLLFDKMRVLKAIQPIPKGSQLFVSYGVAFNTDTIDSRLFYCMDHFNFKCTCQPCLEKWPLDQSIPNHIFSSNLINPNMKDAAVLEYKKFIEFRKRTKPNEFHHHLNYLYNFNKFMFANIKRPFKLYEECLSMISTAHNYSSMYQINSFNC